MDNTHILKRIRFVDIEIKQKLDELARLENTLFSSPQLKQVSVQESKAGLKDDTYVKIMGYKDTIEKKIEELVDLKRRVLNVIDSIDDTEKRLILTMRYVNLKTWEQIERDLPMSRKTMFIVHKKAVKEFDTKYTRKH